MSDERLRQLHRSASLGDPQAEAKLLLARLRAGELSQRNLELAAYLSHPVACLALGVEHPNPAWDLPKWTLGLAPWGRRACAVAGLEAARLLSSAFEDWLRLQPRSCQELAEAFRVACAWAEQPNERDQQVASARCMRFLSSAGTRLYGVGPDHVAANAVTCAVRAVFEADYPTSAANAVAHATRARSPRAIHRAIQGRLLPLPLTELVDVA
jgi:hypothetical protein